MHNYYQPNPLGQISYGLILIHGGDHHAPSNQALLKFRQYDHPALEEIEVVDDRIKQWLTNNNFGIKISHLPCLVLIIQGQPTRCFPVDDLDQLVNSIQS